MRQRRINIISTVIATAFSAALLCSAIILLSFQFFPNSSFRFALLFFFPVALSYFLMHLAITLTYSLKNGKRKSKSPPTAISAERVTYGNRNDEGRVTERLPVGSADAIL